MSAETKAQIPRSMLNWLASVPRDLPVSLLLRHSVRDDLPPDEVGYALPITPIGEILASEFGALLGPRLRSLHTSPLLRCVQTAEALRNGAGIEIPIHQNRLLGDPGVFVIDGMVALENWKDRGHEGVMNCLVNDDLPLPGMAAPLPAARKLVREMLGSAKRAPGMHVFVTHDSLVTATVARMLSAPLKIEDWPEFLEGGFFWQEDTTVVTGYRDLCARSEYAALKNLQESPPKEQAWLRS